MKKVTIKINTDLDFIRVMVEESPLNWITVSKYPSAIKDRFNEFMTEAKMNVFTVAHEYTEKGYKVELNPYVN